jgi:sortase A
MMKEFTMSVEAQESEPAGQDTNDVPKAVKSSTDLKINGNILGIMAIPKINLKVAVVNGVDKKSLKYAVGHFKETAGIGEAGNCAIAGHRSYTFGQFFNRLDELKIGDEIDIKTKTGDYRYIVYEKKVVEPDDISVLNNTKDATITLVTCHPLRIATHRLIVKGRLQYGQKSTAVK